MVVVVGLPAGSRAAGQHAHELVLQELERDQRPPGMPGKLAPEVGAHRILLAVPDQRYLGDWPDAVHSQ